VVCYCLQGSETSAFKKAEELLGELMTVAFARNLLHGGSYSVSTKFSDKCSSRREMHNLVLI
jgi:hypothetical protein